MRKLVSHLIVTQDGIVDFGDGFQLILDRRNVPDVLSDIFQRITEESTMLLGRVTFEQWREYWSGLRDQPFADHINAVEKVVASRSLAKADWTSDKPVKVIGKDLKKEIKAMKASGGGSIGVHGSPHLVESLLKLGLVDELRLEVVPVLGVQGRRLFDGESCHVELELLSSKTYPNGVSVISYRPLEPKV